MPLEILCASFVLATSAAAAERATTLGGYGEMHYTNVNGPEQGAEIDFRRFVFSLDHRFHEHLTFESAVELAHGGERLALDHAHLQYTWNRYVGVRGGLLLVPVGILNLHQEPTTFHGVERNSVDTLLVPTTWREGGVAIFGEPFDGFRYQVALFNGLNAGGFSGSSGIRGGRSESSESATNDAAVAVRLEYAPTPGLELGGSYYEGGAGRQEIDESVSIRLLEADVRYERRGIGLRAQAAKAWIVGAGPLNDFLTTGSAPVPPIGSSLEGWYAEAAYDVFELPRRVLPALGRIELIGFARYERTNTQLDMPGAYPSNPAYDRSIATAGVTLKPHPHVAIKADYQWTWTGAEDPPNVWHLGLGYRF